MAELTSAQTGRTLEQITEDADRDRWFTAEEAREYGFVDHVVKQGAQVSAGKNEGPKGFE